MSCSMGLEDIGEYRSLLGEPPSAAVISRLWKMLGDTPSVEVIEYLAENLARWPEDVERHPLGAWLAKADKEERAPALALCNTIEARLTYERRWHLSEDWRHLRIARIDALYSDIPTIINAPCLQNLTHLFIQNTKAREDSQRALAEWQGLANLKTLSLSFGDITDAGVDALASSPHIKNLEKLALVGNKITGEGAAALAASPNFTSLKVLDLRHNTIGEDGAVALGEAPFASQLEWLHLYKEDATARGLKALSKSPELSRAIRAYFSGKHP